MNRDGFHFTSALHPLTVTVMFEAASVFVAGIQPTRMVNAIREESIRPDNKRFIWSSPSLRCLPLDEASCENGQSNITACSQHTHVSRQPRLLSDPGGRPFV